MLDIDPKNRVKADFFIELHAVRNDREVNKFEWYNRNKFTDSMLERLEHKGLRSVTDFRTVKQYINNAVKAGKSATLSKRLKEFADDHSVTLDHLNIDSAAIRANAKKLLKIANALYDEIEDIDTDEYFGEEELWAKLEMLSKLIRNKLKALGRREA